MKALLLYSKASGRRDFSRYLSCVHKELDSIFETIDIVCPESQKEAFEIEKNAHEKYHVLIVVGGDGTFNNAINAVMQNEERPIIGYINNGTMGDAGRSFGVTKNIKSGIKVIKRQNIKPCDLGKITIDNESKYFSYMTAVGAFSDISYKTKTHKKSLGKLSYYFEAIRQVFKKRTISYKIFEDFSETGFVMILNGPYVGGFKVDKNNSMDDGLMELFASKGKAFNGLWSYVTKKNVYKLASDRIEIEVKGEDTTWCIDGEQFKSGNAVIETEKLAIRAFFKQ